MLDDGAPLATALERCRIVLPLADNVGRSGDDRDVYVLIDLLASAVRSEYPQSLCRRGCDACCHYPQAFFNVQRDEWDTIADHLRQTWPSERLAGFLEAFHRDFGRFRPRLRLAQFFLDSPLPLRPLPQTLPSACPFLEDGACAIYPVRPWKCRAFGHFTFRRAVSRKLDWYACDLQAQVLGAAPASADDLRPSLPSATPIHSHIWKLLDSQALSLPLWIFETWPNPGAR